VNTLQAFEHARIFDPESAFLNGLQDLFVGGAHAFEIVIIVIIVNANANCTLHSIVPTISAYISVYSPTALSQKVARRGLECFLLGLGLHELERTPFFGDVKRLAAKKFHVEFEQLDNIDPILILPQPAGRYAAGVNHF
jgi:hypothetical protein